jgi:uncharacterized protein (TIRG00374 family)
LKSKLSAIARFLLFFGIGVFFIWFSLKDLSPEQRSEILNSFGYANYWWISFSILLGVLAHYIRALRWKMMLEPMGFITSKRNTFFAVMVGYLANLAIPRLGEVSRCTILSRYENVPFEKSFGTVITERALDLIIFALLFLLNLGIQYSKFIEFINQNNLKTIGQSSTHSADFTGTIILILIISALVIGLTIFFFRKKIMRISLFVKIKKVLMGFLEGMKSLSKVKNLWLFVFYSLAIWTLYLLMAYVVFFSLPETSGIGMNAGLAVLVFGTVGIMFSPGGMGVYPLIVQEILLIYFVDQTIGLSLGWLIWSSQTLTIILLGIVSLILLPLFNKAHSHAKA